MPSPSEPLTKVTIRIYAADLPVLHSRHRKHGISKAIRTLIRLHLEELDQRDRTAHLTLSKKGINHASP